MQKYLLIGLILMVVAVIVYVLWPTSEYTPMGYVESFKFPSRATQVRSDNDGNISLCACGGPQCYAYYNDCSACPSALN